MSNTVSNSTQSTQAADSKREDNHSIVSPSSLNNDKYPPYEQPQCNDINRRTKRQFASGLTRHYQNSFSDQTLRCGVFKIFHNLGKSNTLEELLIEDDYDYPQTYLFVEKVIQTLNNSQELSLSLNSEEYQLFFAKKNGTRNTSYPEIDLVNTNLQKAMKCYEKNTLLLQKRHIEKDQQLNLRQSLKQSQSKENHNKKNDMIVDDSITSIEVSSESLCAKKNATKQILMHSSGAHRRSALTDIQSYRQDHNKQNQNYNGKQQQQKHPYNKSSNSSSIFSCFSMCSAIQD